MFQELEVAAEPLLKILHDLNCRPSVAVSSGVAAMRLLAAAEEREKLLAAVGDAAVAEIAAMKAKAEQEAKEIIAKAEREAKEQADDRVIAVTAEIAAMKAKAEQEAKEIKAKAEREAMQIKTNAEQATQERPRREAIAALTKQQAKTTIVDQALVNSLYTSLGQGFKLNAKILPDPKFKHDYHLKFGVSRQFWFEQVDYGVQFEPFLGLDYVSDPVTVTSCSSALENFRCMFLHLGIRWNRLLQQCNHCYVT